MAETVLEDTVVSDTVVADTGASDTADYRTVKGDFLPELSLVAFPYQQLTPSQISSQRPSGVSAS